MKTKRTLLSIITLCAALSLTACNGSGASTTESSQKTQTEATTEAADNSNTKLDDLYQQENQIFADHEEVWNKVFGMMNKSSADPSGDYADYLAGTVESNKESFTDDELKTLNDDIETIRQIEKQISEIENNNTGSESTDQNDSSEEITPFKSFSGKDFDGNSVDESLFSNNAVTVVNFWFTGCKPCVAELSKLNELNDAIKSMGGEVVGINTETFDGNEDAIKEAAAILDSQGAKYRNISIDSDSNIGKYASDIMAFPTTILVDRNGNIVGDPMLGGIDNQDNYDTLMKQIRQDIKMKDMAGLRRHFEGLCEKYQSKKNFSQMYVKFIFSNLLKDVYEILPKEKSGGLNQDIDRLYRTNDFQEVTEIINEGIELLEQSFAINPQMEHREIETVKQYIYAHYGEELSVDMLADQVFLAPSYLSHIFKKETGQNLSKFIKALRMEKAKEMLEETHNKIVNISYAVGYPNVSYFCQSFREYYGVSPQKYRNQ